MDRETVLLSLDPSTKFCGAAKNSVKESDLPPAVLLHLLRFDDSTGKLYWLWRDRGFFRTDRDYKRWNNRHPETEAFVDEDKDGYFRGHIFNSIFIAHRVIWAMKTGVWPTIQIDHINHDRSDNRIENLREANNQENNQNQTLRSTNTSGVCGVFWNRDSKKWQASITVSGHTKYLGIYKLFDDAVMARRAANIEYGFHHNHGEAK